jgi:hypothetical protein
MNARFPRLFEEALRECLGNQIGKLEAIQILIMIWDEVSRGSIRNRWPINEDFGPDEHAPDEPWQW